MKKMKKFLMPFIIGLCSCVSDHTDVQVVDEDAKIVEISIAEMNSDIPDSRWVCDNSAKYWWKSNDVLGIFPVGKGSQLEFPVDLGEGETAQNVRFDGGGWAFKAGYTYSAYSPFNLLSNRGNQIPFSFAGQSRKMDGNDFDLRDNMLMVAPPTSVLNGFVQFKFYSIEAMMRIDLYDLPIDKTYKSLALYAASAVIPQEKVYDIFSMEVNNGIVTINDNVLSYSDHLVIDLQDATCDVNNNNRIRVWMGFPAIGTAYGTLRAVVEDSEGNLYSAPVRTNAAGYDIYKNEIKRHSQIGLRVKEFTPVTDGVSGSIEDWEIGEEILGSAE